MSTLMIASSGFSLDQDLLLAITFRSLGPHNSHGESLGPNAANVC